MNSSGTRIRLIICADPLEMADEVAFWEESILPAVSSLCEARLVALEVRRVPSADGTQNEELVRELLENSFGGSTVCVFLLGERLGLPWEGLSDDLIRNYPWLASHRAMSPLETMVRLVVLDCRVDSVRGLVYVREQLNGAPTFEEGGTDRMRALRAELHYVPLGSMPDRGGDLEAFARRLQSDLLAALASRGCDLAPADGITFPRESSREPAKPHLDENVQFTVYRPQAIKPMEWYPMLAFAHLDARPVDDELDPVAEVARQAEQVLGDAFKQYHDTTQDSLVAVPREGEITFLPEVPGVQFNPSRRTFLWMESVHREEFKLRAAPELDGQTARGTLTVFLGSILLATVSLRFQVTRQAASLSSESKAAKTSVRPYRKIFASYSHKDLAIVQEFERYMATTGDRYLRDWNELRSGEKWDPRLLGLIEEADVFQLFWSWNSMTSPFVAREWQHALSLGRDSFVRPTYWETPFPETPDKLLPPNELRQLHFHQLGGVPSSHPTAAETAPLPAHMDEGDGLGSLPPLSAFDSAGGDDDRGSLPPVRELDTGAPIDPDRSESRSFQDLAADSDFSPETCEIDPGPDSDFETPMFDSAFGSDDAVTQESAGEGELEDSVSGSDVSGNSSEPSTFDTPEMDTPAPTQAMETSISGGVAVHDLAFSGPPMPDFSPDATERSPGRGSGSDLPDDLSSPGAPAPKRGSAIPAMGSTGLLGGVLAIVGELRHLSMVAVLLLLTVIVAAAVAIWALCLRPEPVSVPAPGPAAPLVSSPTQETFGPSPADEPSPEAPPQAADNAGVETPSSSPTLPEPVTTEGPKSLVFPEGQDVGDVYTRPAGSYGTWEKVGAAHGSVDIPEGREVRLAFTGADLSVLAGIDGQALHTLSLSNPAVQDADLAHIMHLTSLRVLNAKGTSITSAGIEMVHKQLPQCRLSR